MTNYTKLNKSHQRYFSALCMYGIIVFQKVIQRFVLEEKYEMAQLANETLIGYCECYKMPVPEPIKDIEDYKAEFWRMGMSGENAVSHFEYYQENCYNELNLIK